MKRVVLIACVSKKLPYRAKAKNLYTSPLFKLNLKYAQSLHPHNIFVLSAKHGLVDLDKEIEPYDITLNTMQAKEIKSRAHKVIKQLQEAVDTKMDEVILLAGEEYRRYLVPYLTNFKIPLKGLTIGKQLKYLKKQTSHE